MLLETCGELLPVTYKNGTGYIFNPLITAEQLGATVDKLTSHDQHGNLAHFGFVEAKLKDTAIFKTRLDTWTGIFCSDKLKRAYENAGLMGITFHPDVSNPIGEPHGTIQ